MKIINKRNKYIDKHSQVGDIVNFSIYRLKIQEEESCLYCFFYNRICPKQAYYKHFSREDEKDIVYKRL
jgi:hypothetical protein